MRYRIEVSQTRKGFGRVNFPGRVIAIEATQHVGPVWQVAVIDLAGDGTGNGASEREGSVTVRADSPSDAVWRIAQAAVRAVAELTNSTLDGEIKAAPDSDTTPTKLSEGPP
jgi:hypothetical protein